MNGRSQLAGVALGLAAGAVLGAWFQGTAGASAPAADPDAEAVEEGEFGRGRYDFQRMYGAIEVGPGVVPWMMALVIGREDRFQHCGAAFIHPLVGYIDGGESPQVMGWDGNYYDQPRFALTAAHCLFNGQTAQQMPLTNLFVVSGTTTPGEGGEIQPVVAVAMPDDDDRRGAFAANVNDNDIAVLLLGDPIGESGDIDPGHRRSIEIATTAWAGLFLDYTALHTAGWGKTEETDESPNLLEVRIPLVARDECVLRYASIGTEVPLDKVCAGYSSGEYAHCYGDSGGPLYYRPDVRATNLRIPRPMLIGVVSSQPVACADPGFYGFYTNTFAHEPWIRCEVQAFMDALLMPDGSWILPTEAEHKAC